MLYLFAKALHVVGFVSWFAGLLYAVRLFIYDVEAAARPEAERRVLRTQLRVMQRRLWYGITWPAMVLTFVPGVGMAFVLAAGEGALPGWFHAKLVLLAGLVLYHLQCGRLRKQLEHDVCHWQSRTLRIWNEVGTVLLVAIVFVAVFRSALAAAWAVVGLGVFAAVLMGGVFLYERLRRRAWPRETP